MPSKINILIEYNIKSSDTIIEKKIIEEGLIPWFYKSEKKEIRSLFILTHQKEISKEDFEIIERKVSGLIKRNEWMLIFPKIHSEIIQKILFNNLGKNNLEILPKLGTYKDQLTSTTQENIYSFLKINNIDEILVYSFGKFESDSSIKKFYNFKNIIFKFIKKFKNYFFCFLLILFIFLLIYANSVFHFYENWKGDFSINLSNSNINIDSKIERGIKNSIEIIFDDYLKKDYYWNILPSDSIKNLTTLKLTNLFIVDSLLYNQIPLKDRYSLSNPLIKFGVILVTREKLTFPLTKETIQRLKPSIAYIPFRITHPIFKTQAKLLNCDLLFATSNFDSINLQMFSENKLPDLLVINKDRYQYTLSRNNLFDRKFKRVYKEIKWSKDFNDSTLFEAPPIQYHFFIKQFEKADAYPGKIGFFLEQNIETIIKSKMDIQLFKYENIEHGLEELQIQKIDALILSALDYAMMKDTGRYNNLFAYSKPFFFLTQHILVPKNNDENLILKINRGFEALDYHIKKTDKYSNLRLLCGDYNNDNKEKIIEWFPQ